MIQVCCKLAQVFWSSGQGDETVNFGDQGVKGQGHTMLQLVVEAWQGHRF